MSLGKQIIYLIGDHEQKIPVIIHWTDTAITIECEESGHIMTKNNFMAFCLETDPVQAGLEFQEIIEEIANEEAGENGGELEQHIDQQFRDMMGGLNL